MLPIPLEQITARMRASAHAIEQTAGATPEQHIRRRPAPDQWSVLEQVNHLHDEERLDFRVRLKFILDGTPEKAPPIDPPRWAVEGRYNERDPEESLANFMDERAKSLEWLEGLDGMDPQKSYKAPFGELKAGDVLYSWLMHDLLHLRQMADTQAQCHAEDAKPYSVEYAG